MRQDVYDTLLLIQEKALDPLTMEADLREYIIGLINIIEADQRVIDQSQRTLDAYEERSKIAEETIAKYQQIFQEMTQEISRWR